MTRPKDERRHPDRPHLMQRLLRRVAVLCLVAAAGIVFIPRALVHLAVLGPSTADRLGAARQALVVARGYGATNDMAALAAAEREMSSAEALDGQGQHHEARHAAERALRLAGEAQQEAIVRREGQRIRAKEVIDQVDRGVDELEEIYNVRSKGLPKPRQKEIFSEMKQARSTAAALVLAWEQQDYPTVLQGESRAMAVIAAVKQELQGI